MPRRTMSPKITTTATITTYMGTPVMYGSGDRCRGRMGDLPRDDVAVVQVRCVT
jgi:hypothetical protein